MRITERIAVRLHQLRSLFSNKEKIMSDQTVINPTSAAQQELSPLESFANETASAPAAANSAADSVAQPATPPAAATPAAQPAAPASAEQPFHADAPVDLDQQLATQDTLANGSASAGVGGRHAVCAMRRPPHRLLPLTRRWLRPPPAMRWRRISAPG